MLSLNLFCGLLSLQVSFKGHVVAVILIGEMSVSVFQSMLKELLSVNQPQSQKSQFEISNVNQINNSIICL